MGEAMNVNPHWRTSVNVGALVTLVAGVHYFYMREFWVELGTSPILYRYIDWSITVPLQMIEFYFDSFCSAAQLGHHDVLAIAGGYGVDVGFRLLGRGWLRERMDRFCCGHVRMGLHPL